MLVAYVEGADLLDIAGSMWMAVFVVGNGTIGWGFGIWVGSEARI
jgi:hypothetical protein